MAVRKYGESPFSIVTVHGGPGAGGEMAPVARELASNVGVLEPIQSALSIKGQIEELKNVLQNEGALPATLVGFSWGAWLSYLVAAAHPLLIEKLILIASGPFEEKYAAGIKETRMNRFSEEERREVDSLLGILNEPAAQDKNSVFERFGALFSKVDAYDPIGQESEAIEYRADLFQSLWPEVEEMRRKGHLLKQAKDIACPVVAIHGDYDAHPFEGVQEPLSANLKNFRFILLENCGHRPWIEREVRDIFYQILKEEIHR